MTAVAMNQQSNQNCYVYCNIELEKGFGFNRSKRKEIRKRACGKCVCGELPGERPAKKGFNTIAYQMGKGQGMQFISEDTQLEDKWGKHFISVDTKERQIKTTV